MAIQSSGRDIIVIGASAGGIEAVTELVSLLPADLPAAIFVVIHIAGFYTSKLPDVFAGCGKLRATHAIDGEVIERGHIYVAPPDNHLAIRPGYLGVARGPKENGHRPSVDTLFRTASASYGPRVVGVVLSGNLDCGTAGMLSIKARGGIAIVQSPEEALAQAMPRSVIQHTAVDHVAPIAEIAELLNRHSRQVPSAAPGQPTRALRELEGDESGIAADLVCPTCQGRLSEVQINGFSWFRCHVGHAFSLKSIVAEQTDEVERALWAAVRALEESATLARRLASSTVSDMQQRFREREYALTRQADVIRKLLLSGETLAMSPEKNALGWGEAGDAGAGDD